MPWKTIASCMIIFGTQGIGVSCYFSTKNKLIHLQNQKKILCYMEEQITYMYRPVIEILMQLEREEQEPYKGMLHDVLEKVSQGCLLYMAWSSCTKDLAKKDQGFRRVSTIFLNYAEIFKNTESHEQKNYINMLKEALDEEIKSQKEKIKKEGKMYYLLCSVAGLFLIILFL